MSSLSNKPSIEQADSIQAKIELSGDGDEFVIMGDKKYYRHELMRAFGGTLTAERYSTYPKHSIGNASAFGLAGHGLSAFVLGLYYTGAMGISTNNAIVALCFFYGGLAETIAAIFELYLGNTFAATAFGSYGAFWFSFGAIFVDSFGISAAYGDDAVMMSNATGFFCLGWAIFSLILTLCSVKATFAFFGIFFFLFMTFLILAVANFTGNSGCTVAGGVFAILAAISGWYCGFAGVATPFNSYFTIDGIPIPIFKSKKSKQSLEVKA